MDDPSPNGPANGRRPDGKFTKGNAGGPGNPGAAEVGKHRARFFAALKSNDVAKALKTIREVMGSGKDADRLAAARELLDRVIGKAVQSDLLERIERLEASIDRRDANKT